MQNPGRDTIGSCQVAEVRCLGAGPVGIVAVCMAQPEDLYDGPLPGDCAIRLQVRGDNSACQGRHATPRVTLCQDPCRLCFLSRRTGRSGVWQGMQPWHRRHHAVAQNHGPEKRERMRCAHCEHDNPDDFRFGLRCSTRLEHMCPAWAPSPSREPVLRGVWSTTPL